MNEPFEKPYVESRSIVLNCQFKRVSRYFFSLFAFLDERYYILDKIVLFNCDPLTVFCSTFQVKRLK